MERAVRTHGSVVFFGRGINLPQRVIGVADDTVFVFFHNFGSVVYFLRVVSVPQEIVYSYVFFLFTSGSGRYFSAERIRTRKLRQD